ncbi:MAG: hypothetical protein NC089_13135 [Bacteroides sp.]|nr:hypothetical protein [Bacteroides sp.]MCM1549251.1 hypothetical protein [Clostridium sp.]
MIFFNVNGWFFPREQLYSDTELFACMKSTAIAALVFSVVVGIPLLLLLVDCFVIMRGVRGFKVSVFSILTAPASYPVIRTEVLNEEKEIRRFHVVAGMIIFASNCLVITAFVYYIIRIMILSATFLSG